MGDLRQASYKGVEFDFVDVGDDYTKSLAKYEYPYRDAPDAEDMGTSQEIKLKAYFLNDAYESHKDFINKVKEPGPGELIHPVYGSVNAIVQTLSVRHDERERTAECDIAFLVVEDLPVLTAMPTLKSKGEELAALNVEAPVEEKKILASDLKAKGIPADAPVAGLGGQGYLASVSGLTAKAKQELGFVNDYVGKAKGYVNPTLSELSVIASDATSVASLPGAVLGAVTGAVNSVAGSKSSLFMMPGKFSDGLSLSFGEMEISFGSFGGNGALRTTYRSQKARALVSSAAVELRADEAAEKGEALSLKDYGQPEAEVKRSRVMTIDEIDVLVGNARGSVNDALVEIRANFGDRGYVLELNLKAQAALLQEMADTIRLRRPQIIEYEVPGDASLHLICFWLYRDINRATELMRLNRVRDPNFIKAGEKLKVYAS